MIIVRKIRLDDARELVRFMIRNSIMEKIQDEAEYYICKVDDVLCGCGIMIKKDKLCIIKNVVVDKECRRERYGSSIVKTMLNSAELGGAETAVCSGNVPRFSEYLNFKKVNTKELPEAIKNETERLHNEEEVYVASLVDYFKSACQ